MCMLKSLFSVNGSQITLLLYSSQFLIAVATKFTELSMHIYICVCVCVCVCLFVCLYVCSFNIMFLDYLCLYMLN